MGQEAAITVQVWSAFEARGALGTRLDSGEGDPDSAQNMLERSTTSVVIAGRDAAGDEILEEVPESRRVKAYKFGEDLVPVNAVRETHRTQESGRGGASEAGERTLGRGAASEAGVHGHSRGVLIA